MKIYIADNIHEMRKQRGMTQEQLAEALGVSIAAVSKWERGIAMPDLSYIVAMADLFETSVDTLIGYLVQSGACEALEERIHNLQKEKRFDEAAIEAEKALIRYPNDFKIVCRCGEMYQLKGMETGEAKAKERAIELWNRAILLLPQNTDPEINESIIQAEIALCYLELGKQEQGIELLKKYNAGGVYNAHIGMNYAVSDCYQPEEAAPFLMKAFGSSLSWLIQTMLGYIHYYTRMNDCESALEAAQWFIKYLKSIKMNEDEVSYLDKVICSFYGKCAHFSEILGKMEEAELYLRKAFCTAQKFDAAPVYTGSNIKFYIGELEDGTAYDDLGATAMEVIEKQLQQKNRSGNLRAIWQKLKEE